MKTLNEQLLETIWSVCELQEILMNEIGNNTYALQECTSYKETLAMYYIEKNRSELEMSFIGSECEWLYEEAIVERIESQFDERAYKYVLEL